MPMGQTRSPRPLTAEAPRAGPVRVRGVVQGVGFRPFVYVAATPLGLSGSVANDSSGLIVEVEGDAQAIDDFDPTPPRPRPSRWSKRSPPRNWIR